METSLSTAQKPRPRASGNPAKTGQSETCPLCSRHFAKESARKRHYYYCRSKQNVSRRKSCAACIRAKTRCSPLIDASTETCIRCNERGVKCEYENASRKHSTSPSNSSGAALGRVQEPEGEDGSDSTNHGINWQAGTSTQVIQQEESNLANSEIHNQEVELAQPTEDINFSDADISLMSSFFNQAPVVDDGFSRSPWAFQLSSPPLFETRAFVNPSQKPLAALALRILRSYAFTILRKDKLPPFLSPLLYTWSKTGRGPPQKALATCETLVNLFKARTTEESKNRVWNLIKLEQERILAQYAQFDRWELLASLQALLIYCLLRLYEVPTGHDVFDLSLLSTVNVISSAIGISVGDRCDSDLPADHEMAWRDWIFNESRRRTVLIFQVIARLVDISTTVSYYHQKGALYGFALVPLPSVQTLWKAHDCRKWRAGFGYGNRTLYGLSEAGALTKVCGTEAGMAIDTAEWEEWSVEVSDMGMLVMIVGEMLGSSGHSAVATAAYQFCSDVTAGRASRNLDAHVS